jgi:hypothetical protein
MRLEELSKSRKSMDLIETRTLDLPICGIVPRPGTNIMKLAIVNSSTVLHVTRLSVKLF